MAHAARTRDLASLPPAHRAFHGEAARAVPADRILVDPLRTLAFGTDASFYRLVPKMVVLARTEAEVAALLAGADRHGVAVTFRAAGTSLSGQAVSDSVLIVLAGGFRGAEVLDGGARIRLEPGVIGADANALLAPLRRKIGPDPASIGACMIGGIVANNASGMCCGTAENSYRTLESLRLLLADGTPLDTADPASRRTFAEARPDVVRGLASLRDEIRADPELSARIAHKYRIKNTTGYGLNAFLDFDDPADLLAHLLVGSEGTLAFVSEVVFRTVADHPHKASALVLFPDLRRAAEATRALRTGPVSAVELMDRASLRAVEEKPGMPAGLRALPPDAAALLVEVRAPDAEGLAARIAEAAGLVRGIETLAPVSFTDRKAEFEKLWDIRRGLFPAVGAVRRVGTTVVIEDVAFPIEKLAEAAVELQGLLRAHGYDEGIIFGHALEGNLHFCFTQDFGDAAEVARYARFMDELCRMVVERYDGSLKAEHGTGRNVAPFVELEWGARATGVMRRLKLLLDPRGLLNPGVIVNSDPRAHLENLKPLPRAHDVVDRCIECGFCEPRCPSRELTTTPRQRIVVQREIARLRASGAEPERRARLERDFVYLGEETCATDGLCATACPVGIDTGQFVKALRAAAHGSAARTAARAAAVNLAAVSTGIRGALAVADAAHAVLGSRLSAALSRAARAATGGALPLWNPAMPRPAHLGPFHDRLAGRGKRVVYFPSCVVRTMGPARGDAEPGAFEATLSVLAKAGFDVLFPRPLDALCCGMPFESKGFVAQADAKAKELERALLAASGGGELPVLCETSPCLYRMRRALDPKLALFEPAEFARRHLLPALRIERLPGPVAVHVTCSATKMGLADALREVASACAERVVAPAGVGCCGFAGDRGFSHPELNASALARLPAGLPAGCAGGYSTSRTCEIGLSLHSGIPYRSIMNLLDRVSRPA